MIRSRFLLIPIVMVSALTDVYAEDSPRDGRRPVAPPSDPTAKPSVSAGVGAESFVGNALRSIAEAGPSWNVRASMGSLADVRVELVYAGSSQALTGARMGGARLVSHGAFGLLRANVAPGLAFEPFFFVGAGWTRYHVTGSGDSSLRTPDHVVEIPFGVGIARRFGRFVIDVRAGLSVASAAKLVPGDDPGSSDGESMHRAGVRMNFGLEL